MSITSEGFIVELKLPEGLTPNHMQEYVADLRRLHIRRPSQSSSGFFWDDELRDIAFYPRPTSPISLPSCASVSTVAPPILGPMALVFSSAITSRSGQRWVNNSDFYNAAKQYINLQSAYTGRLHSVGVGTGTYDPTDDSPVSQLVVDTGSSTTWIYGADTKISGTTSLLPRAPRSCAYYCGADRVQPPARGILEYVSGEQLQIQLMRGPFFMIGQDHSKCLAESFTFGVAISAAEKMGGKEMDGILGMGLQQATPIEQVQPDVSEELLIIDSLPELSASSLLKLFAPTQRFTIALGRSTDQKSFMVIGDPTRSVTTVLRSWTPWVATVSHTNWAIHLRSINIAGDTYPVAQNVIIDTGSAFSYLPQRTVDWLQGKLGGKLDEQELLIFPRDPLIKTVTFDFHDLGSIEVDSRWILDGRNHPEQINGRPASLSCIKAGKVLQGGRTMYFLGNYFFRGLMVEFQRLANNPSGQIRIGLRKRDS
ncbi:aspartic peptidase domain-containing protein [Mycena crocata]|nr:aspartic peptidase domain-containing protein [Mycena crocata]